MDHDKLKALAAELAKDLKTEKDFGNLTQQLLKMTVEAALNAEMREHLGYEKHQPRALSNVGNGSSRRTLKSQYGEVEIATPRTVKDRLNHNWLKSSKRV